jgi:uncharacterized glyoxalase superfamily protein PhnB
VPDQEPTTSNIYPSLTYDDAPAAIEWLCRAFGFEKQLVVPGPDGTVMHSELSLGSGVIMVGSARPDEKRVSPAGLPAIHTALAIHVEDPDAHHARAVEAGAVIVQELEDAHYGSRGYTAQDPEGHQWHFATYRPGVWWGVDPGAECAEPVSDA